MILSAEALEKHRLVYEASLGGLTETSTRAVLPEQLYAMVWFTVLGLRAAVKAGDWRRAWVEAEWFHVFRERARTRRREWSAIRSRTRLAGLPGARKGATEDVEAITAEELLERLREYLPVNEWALFFEVPDAMGFGTRRRADAIGVGLWPSGGHEVHGFEVKVSRSDWLRELKEPDKASTFTKRCNRWVIVAAGPHVVKKSEIPDGYGLLYPNKEGGLRAALRGRSRTPEPMNAQWFAVLARAAQRAHAVNDAALVADAYERGKRAALSRIDARVSDERRRWSFQNEIATAPYSRRIVELEQELAAARAALIDAARGTTP